MAQRPLVRSLQNTVSPSRDQTTFSQKWSRRTRTWSASGNVYSTRPLALRKARRAEGSAKARRLASRCSSRRSRSANAAKRHRGAAQSTQAQCVVLICISLTQTDLRYEERKGALDNAQVDDDAFDIAVEDAIADRPAKRGRGGGRGGGLPRHARDKKFGFWRSWEEGKAKYTFIDGRPGRIIMERWGSRSRSGSGTGPGREKPKARQGAACRRKKSIVESFMTPTVLYHCPCLSSDPIPPPPNAPSSSYQFHPLHELFFCEECDAVRCNHCVSVEVSGYYCPNCLFEVPSASVRAEKNRSVSIFWGQRLASYDIF
jgi:hypothetical protein